MPRVPSVPSVPSVSTLERILFFVGAVAVVTLGSLQGTGALDAPPPVFFDVPLYDVCPPAGSRSPSCGWGLADCHAGMCYGVGGPGRCSGAMGNEAWLLALADCAQPAWWPWLLTAFQAAWALLRVPGRAAAWWRGRSKLAAVREISGGPGSNTRLVQGSCVLAQLLLLAASACVSAGRARPYWILAPLALAVAGGAFRSAIDIPRVDSRLRFVLLAAFGFVPSLLVVTAICGAFVGYDAGEMNRVFVVYACVVTGFTALGCVAAARLPAERLLVRTRAFPRLGLAALLAFILVVVFYTTATTLTWLVWPLYLLYVNSALLRLAVEEETPAVEAAEKQG